MSTILVVPKAVFMVTMPGCLSVTVPMMALSRPLADHARNRRAVHVHIEHAKKDADPVAASSRRRSVRSNHRNIGHLAISRRNQGPGYGRNLALRITEKPQEESCQQQQRDGVRPDSDRT